MSVRQQLVDRGGKENRISQVASPIIGTKLQAVLLRTRDCGIDRYGGHPGLHFCERSHHLSLKWLQLRTVKCNVEGRKNAAENILLLQGGDQLLKRAWIS